PVWIFFLSLCFFFSILPIFSGFSSFTCANFIPIVKLAVFGSVVAFILFVFAMKTIGIARANVFANLIPVFTALFSFILLNETFNTIKIMGMVIVISGVVMSQIGTVIVNRIKNKT
ncbi:MAG: DMT family transporter, partial [Bacteroidales bacterium]|nr:DMT family transporter [Bacteroidales bacterium]